MTPTDALIQEIHKNALLKGFWDEGRQNIAEKLALIGTEVWEIKETLLYDGAVTARTYEEIADIIIRILDIYGWFNRTISDDWPYKGFEKKIIIPYSFRLEVYDHVAAAVQAHRKSEADNPEEMFAHLHSVIMRCADFMLFHSGYGALHDEVLLKVSKNKNRSRLHGARY